MDMLRSRLPVVLMALLSLAWSGLVLHAQEPVALAVGDTVTVAHNPGSGNFGQYELDAEQGSVVTLRWERPAGDFRLQISATATNGDGAPLLQTALLQRENVVYMQYMLEGPLPYTVDGGTFSDEDLTISLLDETGLEIVLQPVLRPGDTVQVNTPPTENQLLAFPLELPADQPMLLQVRNLNDTSDFGALNIEPGVIRDANGLPIETELSDATFNGGISFISDGELPYRYDMTTIPEGVTYEVSLSSFFVGGNTVEFGQPVEGTTLDGTTLLYALTSPAEEDQWMTLRVETTIGEDVNMTLQDANGEYDEYFSFGTTYVRGDTTYTVAVTRVSGPPPYSLAVYNPAGM
ncbi:MAG: hypothetical protein JNL34_12020 [Anaerolineae bacterium]|nr:hypothetical protein [Anaerolineae bacterium]